MNDKYKTSIHKALDNYFELLSHASKTEAKKRSIIKNIKKRGAKNDQKRH